MWCWQRFHFQHVGCLLVLWVALAPATGNVNSLGDDINKALDETIDPCFDFYHYSCREWIRHHDIPEGEHHYNRFKEVKQEITERLKGLLETPYNPDTDRTYVRKAKDLYRACVDEEQLARLGARPIQDLVKGLKFWPSTRGTPLYLEPALAEVNELFKIDDSPLLNAFVYADRLNYSNNIVRIDEGRTFLRRRDILRDGQWSARVKRYVEWLTAVMVSTKLSPGDWTGNISKLMEFEIKLANSVACEENPCRCRADRTAALLTVSFQEGKSQRHYSKWKLHELHRQMPWFNWIAYLQPLFDAAGQTLSTNTEVAVQAAESVNATIKLCRDTDSKTIADYLMIRVLMQFKKYLSKQGKDRSMKCIKDVTKFMGAAVGKMYSDNYFSTEDKHTVADMASEITNAFKQMILDSNWLSRSTKIKAVDKVGAIESTFGFPDWYEDPENMDNFYADVDYSADAYFNNSVKGFRWLKKCNAESLPNAAKRHDFLATEVNFKYGPPYNDIMFPAAVFLPPFYDKRSPRSMRYGAIGMFIGHEIMHSVGLTGRHHDKNGKLDAWPEVDLTRYDERCICFLQQYNEQVVESYNVNGNLTLEEIIADIVGLMAAYKVNGNLTLEESIADNVGLMAAYKVNGNLTLEESIADNVGLMAAYKAYKDWTEKNDPEPPVAGLERFSHEKLFFISYGQMWCDLHDTERMEHTIETSLHGPSIVRARVPPANIEDFARIFNCTKRTNMNPIGRCTLW